MSHILRRWFCAPWLLALVIALMACSPGLSVPTDEAYAPVKAKLDQKIKVQFLDTPLDRTLEQLQRDAGEVTFLIDRSRLADVLKTPVSLEASSMSIRTALDWVTRVSGTDWDVRDGIVFISTPTEIVRPYVTLEVYDVRAITQAIPDFASQASPEIDQALSNTNSGGSASAQGVARAATGLFGQMEQEAADLVGVTGEDLVEIMKHSVPQGRWDEIKGVDVTFRNGVLTVMHTPAIQQKIAAVLQKYQAAYGRQVAIEARFLMVRTPLLEQQLAARGNVPVMEAPAGDVFIAALLAANAKTKVLGSVRTTCYNSQRVNLNAGTDRAFVSDIEPIPGAAGVDPTLSTTKNGTFLDIQPIVSFDGKTVSITFRSNIILGSGMTASAIPVGGREGGLFVDAPAPAAEADAPKPLEALNGAARLVVRKAAAANVAELQMPEQDVVRYFSTVRIPTGGLVVLTGASSQFAHTDADGSEVVLILRARVVQ